MYFVENNTNHEAAQEAQEHVIQVILATVSWLRANGLSVVATDYVLPVVNRKAREAIKNNTVHPDGEAEMDNLAAHFRKFFANEDSVIQVGPFSLMHFVDWLIIERNVFLVGFADDHEEVILDDDQTWQLVGSYLGYENGGGVQVNPETKWSAWRAGVVEGQTGLGSDVTFDDEVLQEAFDRGFAHGRELAA